VEPLRKMQFQTRMPRQNMRGMLAILLPALLFAGEPAHAMSLSPQSFPSPVSQPTPCLSLPNHSPRDPKCPIFRYQEEAMCIECLKSEQRMDDPMDIDETPSPPLPSPSPLGLLGQFVHAQLQPRASSQRAQPQPSSRRPRPQSANPFLQAFGQHQHGHASPAAASLSRIGAVLHGRSNRGAGLSTMARQPSRGATGQPSAPRQAVAAPRAAPRPH